MVSSNVVQSDELEFYTDLAMNESQRWIEAATRERFFDEDDFLYSLRHGTQLRKVLNIIRPGCISLLDYEQQKPTCSSNSWTDDELTSDDEEIEPWTVKLLNVCRVQLQIDDRQLFRNSDLDELIDENGRKGCLPVETLSKVRRVVVTIYELASLCESLPHYVGPKIDRTALEPLLTYHKRINDHRPHSGVNEDFKAKKAARRLHKDVKHVLTKVLDSVCDESRNCSPWSLSPEIVAEDVAIATGEQLERKQLDNWTNPVSELRTSVEEEASSAQKAFVVPPTTSCSEISSASPEPPPLNAARRESLSRDKVVEYLQRNDFHVVQTESPNMAATMMNTEYERYQYTEYARSPVSPENPLDTSMTDAREGASSRASYHKREMSGTSDESFPTRPLIRPVGSAAVKKDALKYVYAKSNLDSSAKQTLDKLKEQHISREQLQRQNDDDQEWMNDFENWSKNRRAKTSTLRQIKAESDGKSRRSSKGPAGGRSLGDLRLDYDEDDQAQGPYTTSSTTRLNFGWDDDEKNDDGVFRRSAEEPVPTRYAKTPSVSDANKRHSGHFGSERYSQDFDDSPRMRQDKFHSTPLNSSFDTSMTQQEEETPMERVVERTKVQQTRTTYIPTNSPDGKTPYKIITASSQSTNSKQTLSMDRTPSYGNNRLTADVDSGVETSRESPLLSPMIGADSLSPKSQSSADELERNVRRPTPTSNSTLTMTRSNLSESYTPKIATPQKPPVQQNADHNAKTPSPTYQSIYGNPTKSNIISYRPNSSEMMDELTVTIKQRPSHEKGFGFALKGGRERNEPLSINAVIVDSAADKSHMQIGDQLVEIDGENVTNCTLAMANLLVSEAIRVGQIDLLLRRPNFTKNRVEQPIYAAKPTQQPMPSPRMSRKQSSFDETRKKFDNPPPEPVRLQPPSARPGKLDLIDHNRSSSLSNTSSKSPNPNSRSPNPNGRNISPIYNSPTREVIKAPTVGINSQYTTSPATRRRQPGNILNFVPEVDRPNSVSTATVTLSPNKPNENSTSRSTPDFEGPDDPKWQRERDRIMHGKGVAGDKQHPSTDAEYHEAPIAKVHYDTPPSRTPIRSTSSMKSVEEPDYYKGTTSSKAEAAMTISKVLNVHTQQASPKIAYENIVYDDLDNRSSSMSSASPQRMSRERSLDDIFQSNNSAALGYDSVKPQTPLVVNESSLVDFNVEKQPAANFSSSHDFSTDSMASVKSIDRKSPLDRISTVTDARRNVDSPKPFGHVKHEPIAFSFEPIPGANRNGAPKAETPAESEKLVDFDDSAPLGVRTTNDAARLYSREAALNQIQATFGGRAAMDRRDSAELKYLELQAMENEQRNARKPLTTPRSMPPNSGNIYDHWMVKDAGDMRLSNQLKAERSGRIENYGAYEMSNGQYDDMNGYGNGYDAEYSSYGRHSSETNGHRPPSPKYPTNDSLMNRFTSPSSNEGVKVSDRQICSHCLKELGRGPAMSIESLNLYYHLNCFKCYVCGTRLSDGAHGADVRVKAGKLNCQSCYINDDTGDVYSEL